MQDNLVVRMIWNRVVYKLDEYQQLLTTIAQHSKTKINKKNICKTQKKSYQPWWEGPFTVVKLQWDTWQGMVRPYPWDKVIFTWTPHRVRVSENCNHEITQLRNISENLRKSLAKYFKIIKLAIILCFHHKLTKFASFSCF